MEVVTGFEPDKHGFRFRNSFSGADVIDELVEDGRLDELVGMDLPRRLEDLVGRVRDADFWSTFGLCGGMSWYARDRYLGREPPLDEASHYSA